MTKSEQMVEKIDSLRDLMSIHLSAVLQALKAEKTWAIRDLGRNELLLLQSFAAYGILTYFEKKEQDVPKQSESVGRGNEAVAVDSGDESKRDS